MADWLDTRDPWLPKRMRHASRIAHWEKKIGAAVVQAMTRFFDVARAGVLGESGSTGLTAAAEDPPPEEPPNLDGWPDDVVWEAHLTDIVLPVVAGAFDEAFERAYRGTITASEIEPYRVIYLGTVWDRLRIWPRGAFEEIRVELAEGVAAGENVDQLRDRVGRVLRIDARSRAIEDRIAVLDAHIDDPATPTEQRRAARAERRQLYRDLDVENSRWQWKARRIARTEVMAASNGGALYGAEAWQQTSGEELWKVWLATGDTRVRNAHWVADQQVRPLLEPFQVGGYSLRHPGDPLAPAHLSVNCRCALITIPADQAAEQQALYERTRAGRTDIDGNPLDDLGRPIVAAAPLEATMPYRVAESADCPDGKPWAVIKTDGGEVMGCHDTEDDAQEQRAAICANDPDECADDDDDDDDDIDASAATPSDDGLPGDAPTPTPVRPQEPADTELLASAWTAMQDLPPMPASWFAEPADEELPPGSGGVHVDGGRIYGWVARAGEPHAGYPGQNLTVESLGQIDLSHFLRQQFPLDNGEIVRAGALTMNVGHHRDGAECETAACQFDDTRTVAGIVTVGMNDGGMWFSGAAGPWLSEWDRQVFAACQPSYHMIPGDDGRMQLRAVLTVPVPGHSSPLAASIAQRSNLALAASAAAAAAAEPEPTTAADGDVPVPPTAREIAVELHIEIQAAAARTKRAGQLQRRMTGPRVAALAARMGRQ